MITIKKIFRIFVVKIKKQKIMKKLLGGLFAVAIAIFMFSCNPTTQVTITVTPETVNAGAGTVVKFVYVLTPDAINNGELGDFEVTDSTGTKIKSATYSGTSSKTDSVTYTVPNNAVVGSTITLNFTATDGKSGKTNTMSADIKVVSLMPEIATVTGKQVLYVSTNASTPMGWQFTTDAVNITNANSNDADLTFFFNDARRQQIWSADAKANTDQAAYSTWTYSTTGKKQTKVQKYTGSKTFDQLTKEDINGITVTGTVPYTNSGYGVTMLQAGDICIFQLADGRKGAFKVAASNPPYTKSLLLSSNVTLDLKFQKTASAAK